MVSDCDHFRKRFLKGNCLRILPCIFQPQVPLGKRGQIIESLLVFPVIKLFFIDSIIKCISKSQLPHGNSEDILVTSETLKICPKFIHYLELKFQIEIIALASQCSVNEKTYQMFIHHYSHSFTWQIRMFSSLFHFLYL